MRPGSHAAGDGSFGRSAGIHVGKAVALVAVAVVIGGLLLHRSPGTGTIVASGSTTTTVAKKHGKTTTTLPPVTTTTTTVPLRSPNTVRVLVANGTTVTGMASHYTNVLHADGYDTLASTNTTARGIAITVVYYASGFQPEAVAVTHQLGLAAGAALPMPAVGHIPVANLNGANILVIIGLDLARGGIKPTTTIKH